MSGFNSLLRHNYFPVPLHRGFDRKIMILLVILVKEFGHRNPESMNFPVFSQLAGNFGFPETSSLLTAPSASPTPRISWVFAAGNSREIRTNGDGRRIKAGTVGTV
jgi:hypothetical protein